MDNVLGMGRAHRLRVQQGVFHVTHRCHNRAFLLKFARDRDAYRAKIREGLQEYDIALLDYCLTCNHVHLLIDAEDRLEVSGFMRKVAGEFARAYNTRKARINAFWGDNFHATLVDTGEYLWRCLRYIEMNMVRCGVVCHPRDWEWVGHHEIMGNRHRYRLLDLKRLCWRLETDNLEEVRKMLATGLDEMIARRQLEREPWWTDSLAVGRTQYLERVKALILSRRETEIVEHSPNLWSLQEAEIPYGEKSAAKTNCNPDY